MAGPNLPEAITDGVTTGHVTDHEKIHDLLNEFDTTDQASTKGDLLVVSGGTIKRLPVGTDDQVLTADSAEAAGVKWATGGGGVTDHGDLTGLVDDDHSQYLNETRHDADDHSALQIVEAQITDLDHTDVDAVHVDQAAEIAVVTEKTTPVPADLLLIEDSEAANVKKRVQAGNLPNILPTASTKGDLAVYNGSAWSIVAAPESATGLTEKANSAVGTLQGDAELVADFVLAADPGGSSGVRWAAVTEGALES